MEKHSKIYIAGHKGMVGSSIMRCLKAKGFDNLISRTSKDLDLRDSAAVKGFFASEKPDYVFLAAAKVGGIKANMTFPAEFLYDNLMIQNNVIKESHLAKVKKICFLGSSCIYPRECPQPIKEEYLLTGPLEPTNEGYALAKISGLKLVNYFHRQYGLQAICPMPCNLYGPGDSFDLENSHVLSSLVKRFSDAADNGVREITLWGSGVARREFLHVDDLARAVVFLMENYDSSEVINVGSGKDLSIKELAGLIAEKTGFSGRIDWDPSKPDGMLRKCLDVSRITELGFSPKISLSTGIDGVIEDYRRLKAQHLL
ncbi:MAG TPA: GDP-L-fucose synthase [Candidatus Rifleibacterium sp.]|nr:GDP-L-fucose synthase [Candidatus Rifleibacterium sp.]HPT48230.1 GDP-L-fucose synthase [Candidatus Rifleibacterium sp.]